MQFSVRFYVDSHGDRPVLHFLEDLRHAEPMLHKLVVAGIKKIEQSERHGPPLTEMVNPSDGILELRIGSANIARVFFFFRRGQEIILTNGYVKKRQKIDIGALAKARAYKRDWEERFP
ncbi:MAG: type II toxin-antitoxin system RelE/ParE family toxin [Thermomicrobiales bacterium]